MSWVTPQDKAFDRVSFLSWDLLLNRIPVDPANGLKVYFTQSEYDPGSLMGSGWPNNPAGKNAMLAESAALYYAYSGNRGVIDLVRALLDHQLQYGTTPASYVWGNVPWSTARAGSVTYGNDAMQEGAGVLEPDKVGELGFHGYLRFWQITGDVRYRDAAIACADALVKNIRTGNATQSPWPFRVRAQDGQVVEQYTRARDRADPPVGRVDPPEPGQRGRLPDHTPGGLELADDLPDGQRQLDAVLRGCSDRPARLRAT